MGHVTMYSTSWCGYCVRLKMMFQRDGITYDEVNIEHDPDAAMYVMSVNGGNRTVPTVVFDDGTAMSNPTINQVKAHLAVAAQP